jgi:hypothetical protein
MKKSLHWVVVIVIAAVMGLVAPTAAQAAPYCGIYWGSLDKQGYTSPLGGPLTNIRAGQHSCYDRLVIDLAGGAGYHIGYVPAVPQQASDGDLALRGGAFLSILVLDYQRTTPVYLPTNNAELVNVTGWRTFRQVAWGGTLDGYTTIGLGVRARLPFRVFSLPGPDTHARLVIDVAHQW